MQLKMNINPFILSEKEVECYLVYSKMRDVFNEIDKLIESKIITINGNKFVINNLALFCKEYLNLKRFFSALFLSNIIQRYKAFIICDKEFNIKARDVWRDIEFTRGYCIDDSVKYNAINELVRKGYLIKLCKGHYKLNIMHSDLAILINYQKEHYQHLKSRFA